MDQLLKAGCLRARGVKAEPHTSASVSAQTGSVFAVAVSLSFLSFHSYCILLASAAM